MLITKKVSKIVEVPVDYICNKCGNSLKSEIGNFDGLTEVSTCGSYGCQAYWDGDCFKFSLCQFCLKELLLTFKHSAYLGNNFGGVNPEFIPSVSCLDDSLDVEIELETD